MNRWMNVLVGQSLLSLSIACVFAATTNASELNDSDPLRPPAVTTTSVPPVSMELMQELSSYSSVRRAALADWDPDGRGVLISTRFGDTSQLHRVLEPGGRREQITFLKEPVAGRFASSVDPRILLSFSQGGSERDQIYLLTEGKTQLLTDGESRNRLQAGQSGKSKFVVASNRRNGRDTDLYLYDLDNGVRSEMVFETDGEFWNAADWSPDGKHLLLQRYVSINEGYVAILQVANGKKTNVELPDGRQGAVGALTYSRDGRHLYVATDTHSEFRQLARLDLESNEYEWLTGDIPWDVSDVVVDQVTGAVVFSVNQDGASRLYLLDGSDYEELDIPLGIVSGLRFSPDGRRIGMTLSRPDSPSDVYDLRLADRKLTRWTYSEVGGLDPSEFVVPKRIEFESFDGRKIPAYIYRPRDATASQPVPVLIRIHGGPEGQYRPYFSSAIQYFVGQRGMAVICPNVRGSRGYGKTYLKLDNAHLREDSVRDIGCLLDWIAEQPDLDSKRVAVYGGSYGGYMVLSSLTHFADRIKAGVDIVGIANFITFLERTADYRRDLRRAEYGDERNPEMRATFERINPSNNAEKIKSALLVAHGVNDPRVPFFEAEQIASKVSEQGRSVWTVYANNEGHGFSKRVNRDYLDAVVVMFLNEHLDLD